MAATFRSGMCGSRGSDSDCKGNGKGKLAAGSFASRRIPANVRNDAFNTPQNDTLPFASPMRSVRKAGCLPSAFDNASRYLGSS